MTSRICVACRIVSAMSHKPFCIGCESVRVARAEHITAFIQRYENDYGLFCRTDEVWTSTASSSSKVLASRSDQTDTPFYSNDVQSEKALTEFEIDVMLEEEEKTERKKSIPWKRCDTL